MSSLKTLLATTEEEAIETFQKNKIIPSSKECGNEMRQYFSMDNNFPSGYTYSKKNGLSMAYLILHINYIYWNM